MSIIKPEEVSKEDTEKVLKILNKIKSADELADVIEIPGAPDVGVKIAKEIIDYRAQNGLFTNLKQLDAVPNIGPKRFSYIIESLRNYNPPHEISLDADTLKFRSSAMAPVLNYEIPSPSSYEGRNYIEVNIDPTSFTFNTKAYEYMSMREYLEINKKNISDFLNIASKRELERNLYLVFDLDDTIIESGIDVFNATYNFKDDPVGSIPEGWNYSGEHGTVKIVESIDGHDKVVELYDSSSSGGIDISNPINRTSGTIEFWMRTTNAQKYNFMTICSGSQLDRLAVIIQGGKFKYDDGAFHDIRDAESNQWYHIKVEFNCSSKWHLWIDGDKVSGEGYGYRGNPNNMTYVFFGPGSSKDYGYYLYFDAVGYSWDDDYTIGDNLNKLTVFIEREAIDSQLITALDNLDETSYKDKYNIFKALIQAAITTYNRIPVFSNSMGGKLSIRWVKLEDLRPRIFLIETYKLTNYPGDYGPGRLIKTYSLLPGEETQISVKTWKKTTTTTKEASSILDSYTHEKADEFEANMQKESSQASKIEQSDTFSVNASIKSSWGASANVGFGKAHSNTSIEAGTKYDKNVKSSRENFAKNVLNTTSKHSQKASSKREIEIETSYERTEETGNEIAIVRNIENLNVSRTLNFVFRQMNQQHHSILHLTDLKVAFFNGFPGSMKEYELPDMFDLVRDYSTNAITAYNYLFDSILEEYGEDKMFDYSGHPRTLVKPVIVPPNATKEEDILHKHLRILTPEEGGMSTYVMREATELHPRDTRSINGIIIGANIVTMRTDGVVVEALLGESNALDEYSMQYREEKIRNKRFIANNLKVESDKVNLGMKIIDQYLADGKIEKAAQHYREFFGLSESLKQVRGILGPQIIELESKKLSNI